jgi:hypothetical protein
VAKLKGDGQDSCVERMSESGMHPGNFNNVLTMTQIAESIYKILIEHLPHYAEAKIESMVLLEW